MRFVLVSLFMFALTAHAQEETLSFKNVREGKSFYSGLMHGFEVNQALKRTTKANILKIYQSALKKQDPKKLCAYDLNRDLLTSLTEQSIKINLKGVIYILRQENEIDDVVAKILLNAYKVKTTVPFAKLEEDMILPESSDKTTSQLELITSFNKRFAKEVCFDEAYRKLHDELIKLDKKTKSYQLEALNLLALQEKRISDEVYLALEQARLNELETTALTLASYQQKTKVLRTQYPLRDVNERSDFTSAKVKKLKSSRRQRLYENYSDLQIIMMGNVIKRLRARLEYDAVEISGYKEGVLQEKIPLDPM